MKGMFGGSLNNAEFKPNAMIYTQIRVICIHAVLHVLTRDSANQNCWHLLYFEINFPIFECIKSRLKLRLP